MSDFQNFLTEWDSAVKESNSKVSLFKDSSNKNLSSEQKQLFIKVFYHLRGHFHDFLWYMGNSAPDGKSKKVILDNIAEEFSGNKQSHEELYFLFAQEFGVDLTDELIHQTTYLDFAKKFNKEHLEFLVKHDWNHSVAAFAAYERLDNIDYIDLMKLAQNMGAKNDSLLFFTVHSEVTHFQTARDRLGLEDIWLNDPEAVKKGFDFIYKHQKKMWEDLSNLVLS